MIIKNTTEIYGSVAKFLHWIMAIIIITLLVLGLSIEVFQLPILYSIHETLGVLILPLAFLRLLWHFCNKTPSYDSSTPKGEVLYIHSFHYVLYALMIAIPLTAIIAFNIWQIPISLFVDLPFFFSSEKVDLATNLMEIHKFLALILAIMLYMHVCALLNHHFIKKDNVMLRMLPLAKLKKP